MLQLIALRHDADDDDLLQ